ncbi:MAG: hypothetical protein KAT71_05155, partial [Gammaproteobacteria bacterium]|nr:hypothetical protein [Gammaproteobacteria bacterium]
CLESDSPACDTDMVANMLRIYLLENNLISDLDDQTLLFNYICSNLSSNNNGFFQEYVQEISALPDTGDAFFNYILNDHHKNISLVELQILKDSEIFTKEQFTGLFAKLLFSPSSDVMNKLTLAGKGLDRFLQQSINDTLTFITKNELPDCFLHRMAQYVLNTGYFAAINTLKCYEKNLQGHQQAAMKRACLDQLSSSNYSYSENKSDEKLVYEVTIVNLDAGNLHPFKPFYDTVTSDGIKVKFDFIHHSFRSLTTNADIADFKSTKLIIYVGSISSPAFAAAKKKVATYASDNTPTVFLNDLPSPDTSLDKCLDRIAALALPKQSLSNILQEARKNIATTSQLNDLIPLFMSTKTRFDGVDKKRFPSQYKQWLKLCEEMQKHAIGIIDNDLKTLFSDSKHLDSRCKYIEWAVNLPIFANELLPQPALFAFFKPKDPVRVRLDELRAELPSEPAVSIRPPSSSIK